MGPPWGPPGSCRIPVGPMWAPWTFLSGLTQSLGPLGAESTSDHWIEGPVMRKSVPFHYIILKTQSNSVITNRGPFSVVKWEAEHPLHAIMAFRGPVLSIPRWPRWLNCLYTIIWPINHCLYFAKWFVIFPATTLESTIANAYKFVNSSIPGRNVFSQTIFLDAFS